MLTVKFKINFLSEEGNSIRQKKKNIFKILSEVIIDCQIQTMNDKT